MTALWGDGKMNARVLWAQKLCMVREAPMQRADEPELAAFAEFCELRWDQGELTRKAQGHMIPSALDSSQTAGTLFTSTTPSSKWWLPNNS